MLADLNLSNDTLATIALVLIILALILWLVRR